MAITHETKWYDSWGTEYPSKIFALRGDLYCHDPGTPEFIAAVDALHAEVHAEPPAEPELQLRVGGAYRNRQGEVMRISGHFDNCEYPFQDECGVSYLSDGRYLEDDREHSLDLIEEVR